MPPSRYDNPRPSESMRSRAATSAAGFDFDSARDGSVPLEVSQSAVFSRADREMGYRGRLDGARDLGEDTVRSRGSASGHGGRVRPSGQTGRYYWYGEHRKASSGEAADGSGYGGIYAMSTADFTAASAAGNAARKGFGAAGAGWRNEGLMVS